MLESPVARGAVVVVLLGGLLGLGVWFGSLEPAPALGAYPDNDDLGADYGRYVGGEVVVVGEVVRLDPLVVRGVDGDGEPLRFELVGVDREVAEGDGLWVFGVAEPGHTVRVERSVRLTPSGAAYARGISLLAGLWVLARVVRDWRLDREVVGLVPRVGDESTDADTSVDGVASADANTPADARGDERA